MISVPFYESGDFDEQPLDVLIGQELASRICDEFDALGQFGRPSAKLGALPEDLVSTDESAECLPSLTVQASGWVYLSVRLRSGAITHLRADVANIEHQVAEAACA